MKLIRRYFESESTFSKRTISKRLITFKRDKLNDHLIFFCFFDVTLGSSPNFSIMAWYQRRVVMRHIVVMAKYRERSGPPRVTGKVQDQNEKAYGMKGKCSKPNQNVIKLTEKKHSVWRFPDR